MLAVQSNLAVTYEKLGRAEESMSMRRDVYSGRLRLNGEEHESTLIAAMNYASTLNQLHRFEEAKALLRKTIPVARRALGEGHHTTLRMRWAYGEALYWDPDATLDDLNQAVTTLEEIERIARRVLGSAHPLTTAIEFDLRRGRDALRARETPPRSA